MQRKKTHKKIKEGEEENKQNVRGRNECIKFIN